MIDAVKTELAVIVIGDDAAYDALFVKIQMAANSTTAFAVLDDVNVIYLIQSRKSPPCRISKLHSHLPKPCLRLSLHTAHHPFVCSAS